MSTPDISVIFCEQVRFEASGQFSIVGVWPPHIEAEDFPFSEAMALVLVWSDAPQQAVVDLTLRSGGGAEFGNASFPTGVPAETAGLVSYLPLPPRRITLSAPDTIEVWVGVDGGESRLVGMMRVVDANGPNAIMAK